MGSAFDIYATLGLKKEGFEEGLSGAKESALNFGEVASHAVGNLVSDGVSKAASALVDFGKETITSGSNFEAAMSQVAATMGTSVDNIQILSDVAKEMGSSPMFSATDAAEGLNYLALAGMTAEQSASTLPSVLNLAAAGGMGLAQASDMVTDAMSALGMEFDDSGTNVTDFGDKLAKTASTTNTSVSQLGEAILTVGATGQSMADGLAVMEDGTEVVTSGTANLNAALGILANVGIKGSEGGTHLRNVLLSLQSPTDKASDALAELGVNIYDSNGEMRNLNDILVDMNEGMEGMEDAAKNDYLSTIFNKTDLAAASALLSSAGNEWSELAYTIDKSDGAMNQMADTMQDNLKGALTTLGSATEGFQIAAYEKISEPMTAVVNFGAGVIQGLTERISGSKSEVEQLIEDIRTSHEEAQHLLDDADTIVSNAESDVEELEYYKGLILELNGKPTLTAVEMMLLKGAVAHVSESIPAIGDSWDGVTERVNLTDEAIKTLFADQEKVIMQSAYADAREEAYGALATENLAVEQAKQAVSDAQAALYQKYAEQLPEYELLVQSYGEERGKQLFIPDIGDEEEALASAVQTLKDATEGQKQAEEACAALDTAIENLATGQTDFATSTDTAGTSITDFVELIGSGTDSMTMDFQTWLTTTSTENESTAGGLSAVWETGMAAVENTVSAYMSRIRENIQQEMQARVNVQFSGVGLGGMGSPLSVEPHAKAMHNPYILNGATIFGSMGNDLLMGGEAGSEMVVGTNTMMGMISEASGSDNVANVVAACTDQIMGVLSEYLPQMSNQAVYIDSGALVGQITPQLDARLGAIASRRAVNSL